MGPLIRLRRSLGATGARRAIGIAATLLLLTLLSWPALAAGRPQSRLDATLATRAGGPGVSRVIVRSNGTTDIAAKIRAHRGHPGQRLALVDGYVADIPNDALEALAADPGVAGVHLDRPVGALLTPGTGNDGGNGQSPSSSALEFTGAGVGVAVIDSGLTAWHDDLARVDAGRALVGQRVVGFADFTSTTHEVADTYGHGTHVSGIVAGSGYDSDGEFAGVAPGAHLLILKVLDGEGRGYVSDVIRALDFIVASRTRFNLRVVNLSIGAPVLESYETDPLTLAARSAVEAGIVVVAAAGNFGKNAEGQIQYGGITAPGNAPWVLTVGAYSHMGTPDPGDDRVAGYSSRGPTAFDFAAKPDLVAPGTRIVSLNDQGSALALRNPEDLVEGTNGGVYPVPDLERHQHGRPRGQRRGCADVAGQPCAHAQCCQGDPAIHRDGRARRRSAQPGRRVSQHRLCRVARAFLCGRGRRRQPCDYRLVATHHLGNRRVSGGLLQPWGTAWGANIIWGSGKDNIIWGSGCPSRDCDNIIWGSAKDNIIWGSGGGQHHLGLGEGQHHLGLGERQHHLGFGEGQHHLGFGEGQHHLGLRRARTSSGARVETTSSGAATSSGAPRAAVGTATTSSGAQVATTSSGDPGVTTSSGALATTTSSGDRETTSSGVRRSSRPVAWQPNTEASRACSVRAAPQTVTDGRLPRGHWRRGDGSLAWPAGRVAAAKLAQPAAGSSRVGRRAP